jgi:hypothetical protein
VANLARDVPTQFLIGKLGRLFLNTDGLAFSVDSLHPDQE